MSAILSYLRSQSQAEVAAMSASAELYGTFQVNWRSEVINSEQGTSNADAMHLAAFESDLAWAQKVASARDAYYAELGESTSSFNESFLDALESYNSSMLGAEIAQAQGLFNASKDYSLGSYSIESEYARTRFETSAAHSLSMLDAAVAEMVGLADIEAYYARKSADEYAGIGIDENGILRRWDIDTKNSTAAYEKRSLITETKKAADALLNALNQSNISADDAAYQESRLNLQSVYDAALALAEETYHSTLTTAENDACGAIDAADQTYNNSFDSLSNLFGTALEIIDNGGTVTEEHFSGFAQVSANNVLPSGEDGNDKPNKQAQDKNIYVVPVYDPLTTWQIITRQRPTLNRYELRITGNSETIILGEVEPNNVLMAPGQLRPTRYNDPKFYLYWSIPEDTQKALETMMSKTDPVTILGFFDDFLAGRGAPEVHFDETTPFVQSMRNHSFVLEQRAKILESIAKGKTSKFEKWHSYAGIEGMFKAAQDIGGIKGAWPSILLVGSYKLTIESEVIDINTVRLSYKIENTMSRESATRIPIWGYREDVENKSILGLSNVQEGMLKDKKMILEWQETVTIPR